MGEGAREHGHEREPADRADRRDHAHRHGHHHGHGVRAGERHRRPLAIALALVVGFLVVQVVVGLASGSLALLSDAGHMATDALGLGMALAAITVASRQARRSQADLQRTFGLYRLEILAALANAALLVAVAVAVLVEAATRLGDPPDVDAGAVLVTGVLGLAVNVVAFLLLREGAAESLNVRGASLEVMADALGSVGVIVAATIVATTGWSVADPLVGAGIGLFILPRAVRLGADALRVLVQAAPRGLDVAQVGTTLASIPGVVDVHDLHVWTLTSDMDVASAHLMVAAGTDTHEVLDRARAMLIDRHHLHHATLQIEPDDHLGCEEVGW